MGTRGRAALNGCVNTRDGNQVAAIAGPTLERVFDREWLCARSQNLLVVSSFNSQLMYFMVWYTVIKIYVAAMRLNLWELRRKDNKCFRLVLLEKYAIYEIVWNKQYFYLKIFVNFPISCKWTTEVCFLSIKHVTVIIIYFAAWMTLVAYMNNFKQFSAIAHIFHTLIFRLSTVNFHGWDVEIDTSRVHFETYTVIANQQGAFVLCSSQLFCVKSTIQIAA